MLKSTAICILMFIGFGSITTHAAEPQDATGAKPQAIKEGETEGPDMVKIPGRNYEIGKYEVTQKLWKNIMGNNPSQFKQCGENCPVERVNWYDIQKFLTKLNQKTGKQYRLPTEAEWEYACYGGAATDFCGSNDIDAVAWYGDDKDENQATHPVGQKQPNGYGLYDMSGNVEEWTQGWFDNEHTARVGRGGSWNAAYGFVMVKERSNLNMSDRYSVAGFRLARTLP